MRILITGVAGFIGSHIADRLLADGHTVAGIDDLSSGRLENLSAALPHIYFEQGDILMRGNLERLFRRFRPEAVMHLAAQPSLYASIENPFRDAQVNIMGTLAVLDEALPYDAKVILASTSAVYGADAALPLREQDCPAPESPYAISKTAAEMYTARYEGPYMILRLGNIYGPRQVRVGENQVVPRAIGYMLGDERERQFCVFGDGWQTRDFVYVKDVAQAFVTAAMRDGVGTFNIATEKETSVNVLMDMLRPLTGYTGSLPYGPAVVGERPRVRLAIAEARQYLGWRPQTSLLEGLKQTVEHWRQLA